MPLHGEAATVVLLQDSRDGPRVLMLRRPDGGSFPGAWVFPGGAVETVDRAWKGGSMAPGATDAARRAAVRETREETGLVVAGPDLAVLSCWIPPPQAPKRLRTWFFLAAAPPGTVDTDPREAVEHAWLAPAQALRLHGQGRLELLPPTWVTLHGLVGVPSAATARERTRAARPPLFQGRVATDPVTGRAMVWAGDVAHDDGVPLERPGPRHRLLMGSRPWTYLTSREPVPTSGEAQ